MGEAMKMHALLHPSPTLPAGRGRAPRQGPPWLPQTLDRLVEHVRTLLAVDGVAFLIVDRERGAVESVADWFSSAELCEAVTLGGRRPYDPERPGLAELALERDRALLLPRVEAWEAAPRLRAGVEEALGERRGGRAWRVLRSASVVACPVKTSVGRPLGVLMVASLAPERPLKAPQLRTVEVLADLAALAIERAELLEQEAARARDELLLKRAAESTSASLELEEVYRRVVRHAAELTGADGALLTRLKRGAGEVTVAAVTGFPDDVGARVEVEPGALGDVVRTRRPYRGSAEELSSAAPGREGAGSLMHAPLELGPRLFGVLSVAHQQSNRFSETDLELLVRLARSSAAAIANAIDFERERRIARALTLGFVPASLPAVPGYESGLLYAPAADEPTGGDVYGIWPLPGGAVAMLVGDVAGKGVETAAMSAMARFFIEARSWDSSSPSAVLSQANEMLIERLPSDTFVTAFFGVLTAERLVYCNAGHLPPLLVRRGETTELEGHGIPLGIARAQAYGEDSLELAPDDLVLAYTDGLFEARRAGELYGMERLAALVSRLARELGPEELVKRLHDEVAAWADGLGDDAVALALRRRPA